MFKKLFSVMILMVSGLIVTNTMAEVVINGTRIVFNAKDKESVVQLKNNGKNPYLLQIWMDDGNPKAKPGEVKVPFIITPPVVRIEPGKGQAVRIMSTNPALPQDRESLFWFNILEIPPKPNEEIKSGRNLLQLAFRTRIKFFYRPVNLPLSPSDAYKNIKITLKNNTLNIRNSSPYFITFSKIEIRKSKNSELLASVDKFTQRMIEPNGEMTLPLSIKNSVSLSGSTLFYSIINDYGGESTNEQAMQNH